MAINRNGIKRKLTNTWLKKQPFLLIIFIISFFLYVIISTLFFSHNFLPEASSDLGERIHPAFLATTIITGITFFVTQTLLFVFAFKYRARPERKAKYLKNCFKLELIWAIVPALLFVFLFIWGQLLWSKMMAAAPSNALTVEVMGAQFSWRVRYPGPDKVLGRSGFRYVSNDNAMGLDISDPHSKDDFIPVQMHVPVNRPVHLLLWSRDVIHSFFVPYMRVKMDAVPGMRTQIHFTPTVTTEEMREKLNNPDFNYEVACAELCGRLHFAMKMILVVDEPDDFEKWSSSQKSWMTMHTEKPSLAHE